ncbi:MAG: NUDIX domain-containing protein, partial [Myxococcales bacterium]|nr:NUDIX domain-containing protein [Myxococcales bacterium]
MARVPLPTWTFALVVVRLGPRFLLVHERKHGGGWYLPAGRVEPGETIAAAAIRETREEAGIPIVLDGILRV